jgi:hypothetical protein
MANSIILSSNDEIKLFLSYNKNGRLVKRVEKVARFIDYLSESENAERSDFGLIKEQSCFSDQISISFKTEASEILRSARVDISIDDILSAGKENGKLQKIRRREL